MFGFDQIRRHPAASVETGSYTAHSDQRVPSKNLASVLRCIQMRDRRLLHGAERTDLIATAYD